MSQHTFRLEAVLRIRRVQEEAARQQLFVQNRLLQAQLSLLDDDRARYQQIPKQIGPVSREVFRRQHAEAEQLAAATAHSAAAVALAKAEASAAHRRWSEAAMRVEALDRLRARRLEEERVEEARREMVVVDDLVTARWESPLASASPARTEAASPRPVAVR